MALAAYNIGFGHLEDARVLTQRGGDNPDVWEDVREYLPLLQKSQFYKTVRRGYARGAEAQAYVDNIYHFYNIIESHAWQRELEAVEYRVEFEDEMTDTNVPYRDILDGPLAPQ